MVAADLAAFDHSDVPFERVVDAVDPRMDNVEPLAQVMLVHTAGTGDLATARLGDLDAEFVEFDDTTVKFDLTSGSGKTPTVH